MGQFGLRIELELSAHAMRSILDIVQYSISLIDSASFKWQTILLNVNAEVLHNLHARDCEEEIMKLGFYYTEVHSSTPPPTPNHLITAKMTPFKIFRRCVGN